MHEERDTGRTFAFLFLRLTLGLHMIFAFVGKISSDAARNFTTPDLEGLDGVKAYIHDGFLPVFQKHADSLLGAGTIPQETLSSFLNGFGTVLPWLELALGVFILFGFLTRTSLWLLLFTYFSLAFGQFMTTWIGSVGGVGQWLNFPIYMAATVAAIALAKHNRFAVLGPKTKSAPAHDDHDHA